MLKQMEPSEHARGFVDARTVGRTWQQERQQPEAETAEEREGAGSGVGPRSRHDAVGYSFRLRLRRPAAAEASLPACEFKGSMRSIGRSDSIDCFTVHLNRSSDRSNGAWMVHWPASQGRGARGKRSASGTDLKSVSDGALSSQRTASPEATARRPRPRFDFRALYKCPTQPPSNTAIAPPARSIDTWGLDRSRSTLAVRRLLSTAGAPTDRLVLPVVERFAQPRLLAPALPQNRAQAGKGGCPRRQQAPHRCHVCRPKNDIRAFVRGPLD